MIAALKQHISSPVLAGICIGIAATTYLNVGGVTGAVFFGFGLMTVITLGFCLFTGRAGFYEGRQTAELVPMLLLNIVGCALVAIMTDSPRLNEASIAIVERRLSAGWLQCGLLAIGCGLIMTTAVINGRRGNWWPLLLGVPTFIICGFPHCVADVYYYTSALMHSGDCDTLQLTLCYIASVIGNYAGCNLYRLAPATSASAASH